MWNAEEEKAETNGSKIPVSKQRRNTQWRQYYDIEQITCEIVSSIILPCFIRPTLKYTNEKYLILIFTWQKLLHRFCVGLYIFCSPSIYFLFFYFSMNAVILDTVQKVGHFISMAGWRINWSMYLSRQRKDYFEEETRWYMDVSEKTYHFIHISFATIEEGNIPWDIHSTIYYAMCWGERYFPQASNFLVQARKQRYCDFLS